MSQSAGGVPAEPFFLACATGQRLCLYHAPTGACRGTVLYVHPFAEEMNRSRRMAALQASALAARGYGVLLIDLYGCGDSSGDFGDARWAIWKQDLACAATWLAQALPQAQRLTLWGVRLGALLALDYARTARHPVASLLLWQPVLDAPAYLTQFLRLRMASAMLNDTSERGGTGALRAALQAGTTLEIAGYDLAPAMAAALDTLAPAEAIPPPAPVYWIEGVGSHDKALAPARARVVKAWQMQGAMVEVHQVPSAPFWTAQETTVAPAWIETTCAIFSREQNGL